MVDLTKLRADLEANLPPLIARCDAARYTGGLYSQKTLEVYDCQGLGIPESERCRIGRKIAYTKSGFINWLINKIERETADVQNTAC